MASQNTDPLANDHLKETDGMRTTAKETHSVTRRLQQELTSLMLSSNPSVSAFPQGDNLFHWVGTIQGGKETVFEGMTFKLSLEFPSGYPFQAPKVRFTTPCFHPNVDSNGNICLDILKEKWSALYDVRTILLSIQSLLAEPNINSPLNGLAANMWDNQAAYDQHLREKFGKGSSS